MCVYIEQVALGGAKPLFDGLKEISLDKVPMLMIISR